MLGNPTPNTFCRADTVICFKVYRQTASLVISFPASEKDALVLTPQLSLFPCDFIISYWKLGDSWLASWSDTVVQRRSSIFLWAFFPQFSCQPGDVKLKEPTVFSLISQAQAETEIFSSIYWMSTLWDSQWHTFIGTEMSTIHSVA